jgi:hypothetical protein
VDGFIIDLRNNQVRRFAVAGSSFEIILRQRHCLAVAPWVPVAK